MSTWWYIGYSHSDTIPTPLLKIPAIPQYKIDCFTVDKGWQKWTSYVFALYRVCNKHEVYPIKTSFLVVWGAIPVCSSFSVKPVGVWPVMQNIMIWQIWKIYPVIQYYTFLDSANIFKLRNITDLDRFSLHCAAASPVPRDSWMSCSNICKNRCILINFRQETNKIPWVSLCKVIQPNAKWHLIFISLRKNPPGRLHL